MTITITWAVRALERNVPAGDVFTVHWVASASDGLRSVEAHSSVDLEEPDPETMIPYVDLTPEIVNGWVASRLGAQQMQAIEDSLQAQIEKQVAPSKATGLPW